MATSSSSWSCRMLPDPRIAALEAHFREVQSTRMQDVPILNPRLWVEAVGFQPFEHGLLGVLISPWFMNLVCLPSAEQEGVVVDALVLELPAGDYEFCPNHAPAVGDFYTCSLFSPVLQFEDQAAAVLTAQHVVLALMDARMQAAKPEAVPPPPGRGNACSRRDFLRGKFA